MPLRHCCFALAVLLIAALPQGAFAQDTWRLNLETVTVDRARESGGDRPYFMMIAFQSRLYARRSTRVELYEREPHDWVSKAEHRSGRRLRLGDHMSRRESLPIPEWMGLHVYDPVEMTSTAPPARTAARAPIFGAFIVALDNNNTPPHAIRNVGETLRDWTEEYLREQVERGGIAAAAGAGLDRQALQESFEAFAREAVSRLDVGRVLETAFGLTVGPLGNPDQLVGMHALVFPAVEEVRPTQESGRFSIPIMGENVGWSITVAPPGDGFRRSLVFEGAGARYRVRATLSKREVPGAARISRLTLRLRTGDDDLREGSQVRAAALDAGGRVLGEVDLNRGGRWADRTTQTAVLPLRQPSLVRDIARIRLTFRSGGGMSGDNWNLDMLTVYSNPAAPALLSRQGRPLMRFTGEARTFEVALR